MSGLVGILGECNGEESLSVAKRMLCSLKHHSWYSEGALWCHEVHASIGWVGHGEMVDDELHYLSDSGAMAIFVIGEFEVSAGEGFQEQEDRIGTIGRCIMSLYRAKGESFVRYLNGAFAGILFDFRERRAVLFNDRYGMKRVFVHENGGKFYFASEAKALLAVLPKTREFDPISLAQILTCGCTIGNRSLYRYVEVLPPASTWIIEGGRVVKKSIFFDPKEWQGQEILPEQEFSEQIGTLIGRLVKRAVTAKCSVGISLTGGLDSRMVAACLSGESERVTSYTFGSIYRETSDVQMARQVARVMACPHQVIELGAEFIAQFPNLLKKAVHISDGYLGMSGAAELYLNSKARTISPVRVTGNFGGELLRGDRAFKYRPLRFQFLSADARPYLEEAAIAFREFEKVDPLTFNLFRHVPYLGYGRLVIENSQVLLRTPFLDNDLVSLVYRAPGTLLKGPKLSLEVISRYRPELTALPTDRGITGGGWIGGRLISNICREATFKGEYLVSHGMPSWLALISRFGLGQFLESVFLGRHKFQHFRVWTQKEFVGLIRDTLLDGTKELGAYFDLREVEAMVECHTSGRGNYLHEIDGLISLTLAYHALVKHP